MSHGLGRAGGRRFRAALSKRYWGADDARVVVDAWRESGQSLKAFAVSHGLKPKRLGLWRKRLESDAEPSGDAPQFIPVHFAAPRAAEPVGLSWRVELGDGIAVSVPCAGGAELLTETLSAIRTERSC